MGYAHGIQWSDTLIERSIVEVVKKAKIDCFPTRSLMREVMGSDALGYAISRYGGINYWAERMGLEIKKCESRLGEEYELLCQKTINEMGFRCEKMVAKHPYDLLVEDNVKVDVKCGNLYKGKNGAFYTFNLEKRKPTCDLFVCYCLKDNAIEKTYIIPASVLSGKTQLSVGELSSKYDKYWGKWDYFKAYVNFSKVMKGE